jgi:hypothetical protein
MNGGRKWGVVTTVLSYSQQISRYDPSENRADSKAMTLEQQTALVAEARARAAASAGASSGLHNPPPLCPHQPAVRAQRLGRDREGRVYLKLACAGLLGAGQDRCVIRQTDRGPVAGCADAFGMCSSPDALMSALDPKGRAESALLSNIAHAFHLNLQNAAPGARLPLKINDVFAS